MVAHRREASIWRGHRRRDPAHLEPPRNLTHGYRGRTSRHVREAPSGRRRTRLDLASLERAPDCSLYADLHPTLVFGSGPDLGGSLDRTELERDAYGEGHVYVAGVDEVGRAARAGPMVAAAVIFDRDLVLGPKIDSMGIRSSKEIKSHSSLLAAFERIREGARTIAGVAGRADRSRHAGVRSLPYGAAPERGERSTLHPSSSSSTTTTFPNSGCPSEVSREETIGASRSVPPRSWPRSSVVDS